MNTTSQRNAFGNGFGINRSLKGASHLPAAVPPYGNTKIHPGLGKQMPGSPKSGHGKVHSRKGY